MPVSDPKSGWVLTRVTPQLADWYPLGAVDVYEAIRDSPDPLDLGDKRIVNVATPEDTGDAATKGYVDTAITALFVVNPVTQLAGARRRTIVLVDLTAGDKTVLLPVDHVQGDIITIKVRGQANNDCYVTPAAGETIDLAASYTIAKTKNNAWVTVMSWGVGVGWLIIGGLGL